MNHQHQLTQEQRDWLTARIRQLRSRMQAAGPFRQAGIHRTIEGMKQQLRSGIWKPHDLTGDSGMGTTPSVDSAGDIADHPDP